jgi:ABC-type branched-subunit amino acid transport system permease subunit
MAIGLAISAQFASDYFVTILGIACVSGLFAAAVDFSWGRAGVLTLGAALYFGIGAYAVALGSAHRGSFIISVLYAVLLSISVAAIIGWVGLRGRDSASVQFGLVTLVASLAVGQAAISLYDLAGGSNGLVGVPRPSFHIGSLVFDSGTGSRYFYLVLVVVTLGFGFLHWIDSGHFGRVATCVRRSGERAATWGYNPQAVRLFASVITAAMASVAGALFVPFVGIAEPSLFSLTPNMLVLVWIALGGQGTLVGPFVAASVLQIVQFVLGSRFEDAYLLIVGILLIIVVRFSSGAGAAAMFSRRERL